MNPLVKTGLDNLAQQLKDSIARLRQNEEDFAGITLAISMGVIKAREFFKADIAFGRWCDENNIDLSPHDRAAYIAFGREPERARGILENTKSRSLKFIHLREFRSVRPDKPQKPKTGPGLTTTPQMEKALGAYDILKASGIEPTQSQVEDRAGVSSTVVRRAFERIKTKAELIKQGPDLADLPKGAQAKVEAAIRKIRKQMETEFDTRLQQAIHAHMSEHILPMYAARLAMADRINSGKKPFTIEEYRKLLGALHPDNSSVERRTEMFHLVKQRELLLRPAEKDKPLSSDLPKTVEELLARRRKR